MSTLITVCLALGTTVFLLAAVGLLRFPDLYLRMHAASKGSTLGIALILLGVSLHFGSPSVVIRALLIVLFLYVTVPISAHVIAKVAYYNGINPWHGVAAEDEPVHDELDRSQSE